MVCDDGSDQRQVSSTGGKAANPKWSPDGSKFAYTANGDLCISGFSGKIEKRIISKEGAIQSFDWSPDGRQIVYSDYKMSERTNIIVTDITCGKKRIITQKKIHCSDLAWAPDGNKIAMTWSGDSSSGQALVIDPVTGREIYVSDFDGNDDNLPINRGGGTLEAIILNLKWTADSTEIYFERLGRYTEVFFSNIKTGEREQWGESDEISSLECSQKLDLAVFCYKHSTGLVSTDLYRKHQRRLTKEGNWCGDPNIITVGKAIAFLSNFDMDVEHLGNCSLFTIDLDGTHLKRLSKPCINSNSSNRMYSWCLRR